MDAFSEFMLCVLPMHAWYLVGLSVHAHTSEPVSLGECPHVYPLSPLSTLGETHREEQALLATALHYESDIVEGYIPPRRGAPDAASKLP